MSYDKDSGYIQLLSPITALRVYGELLYVETASEWYEVSKNLTAWRILPEGSD